MFNIIFFQWKGFHTSRCSPFSISYVLIKCWMVFSELNLNPIHNLVQTKCALTEGSSSLLITSAFAPQHYHADGRRRKFKNIYPMHMSGWCVFSSNLLTKVSAVVKKKDGAHTKRFMPLYDPCQTIPSLHQRNKYSSDKTSIWCILWSQSFGFSPVPSTLAWNPLEKYSLHSFTWFCLVQFLWNMFRILL